MDRQYIIYITFRVQTQKNYISYKFFYVHQHALINPRSQVVYFWFVKNKTCTDNKNQLRKNIKMSSPITRNDKQMYLRIFRDKVWHGRRPYSVNGARRYNQHIFQPQFIHGRFQITLFYSFSIWNEVWLLRLLHYSFFLELYVSGFSISYLSL